MTSNKSFLFPAEPTRFSAEDLDEVLAFCEGHQTSDITLQTGDPIYAEIFGRLYPITTRRLSDPEVGEMLNYIYGPNGTAQVLSGIDVDTYYEFRPNRFERYRYRVNATGVQVEGNSGIQLTLRSIPTTPPPLKELGLPQQILESFAPPDGVVYVTGATGSGKSTLLASMIRQIIEDPNGNRKVCTYEAPIEFVYDAITKPSSVVGQSEIPRDLPSFAMGVRNALRRKPGLILVGEARDQETMAAVLEASLTGHPVYTTLHTTGVAETMRRLVNTFPAGERLARTIDILETVRLIVWQKLVPSRDGKRVALREFLVFNEAVRDQLLATDPLKITSATRALVRSQGQLMIDDATQKYQAGLIDGRTYQILLAGSKRADADATH